MNAVHALANSLSLRPPQREALDILARVCAVAPLGKNASPESILAAVRTEFPHMRDFERDFPSLCFDLATGVGKTRLMGAFIAWLYRERGIRNFFVIAPNLTIYHKLTTDFTPNTPKYVFEGVGEFAAHPPLIVTGDNYGDGVALQRSTRHAETAQINIFNIAKITARDNKDSTLEKDDAGRNIPRMRRLNEYIGESYFSYLAGLDDLVVLMDESHRYRADAGLAAINDLKPLLGLELTATPQVERGAKQAEPFANVIYRYPLAAALRDGFVKEPAVATRQNFSPENYTEDGLERIKLEDGVRIHEHTKVELEIYARTRNLPPVKPFMLVVAQDTNHANALQQRLEHVDFFGGQYQGKVITVHSKKAKGSEGDDIVEKLLTVESPANPVEIVVHVNMLKEGWDVTNLYTIVPLRAANSRTLVEQSIGRGLRLPYGRRTGTPAVDRLTIVSHDRFKDIVDHANDPNSLIRKQVVLGVDIPLAARKAVNAPTTMGALLGAVPTVMVGGAVTPLDLPPLPPSLAATARTSPFTSPEKARIAQVALEVIQQYENLNGSHELQQPEIRQEIARKVSSQLPPAQGSLLSETSVLHVVEQVTRLHQELSIDIPRIVVVPTDDVVTTWRPFTLDLSSLRLQPVAPEILIQHLHDQGQRYLLETGFSLVEEEYPENYIVRGLMHYVRYDDSPQLWRALAVQVVNHLRSYLDTDEHVANVLQYHQKTLSDMVYSQLRSHKMQQVTGYEARVTKGFITLKQGTYTVNDTVRDFRTAVPEGQRSQIRSMLFDSFTKCLFTVQKFDSDPERRFAVVLENDPDVLKWCRPGKDDLRIYHSHEAQYEPDFVVEAAHCNYLCEPKRADLAGTEDVQAKAKAATAWCRHATDHAETYGGKPWRYLLIPHDKIQESMTLQGLETQQCFQ